MTLTTIAERMTTRLAASGASLRVRNYRLYFIGQSISVAGTFMQTLAIAFLTLQLTHSGTDLGIATAARLLPFVLLGPVGGVIADRYDRRRLLFFTQSASAIGSLVFALLVVTDVANFPIVLGLSLALGCVTVLDNPARQSFITDLVDDDVLANAVVLNSISMNVARIAGSVVGGTLVAAIGTPLCFAFNALSFVAVIVNLARMDTGELRESVRAPRARGQIREGFAYVIHTPELAIPLLMVTVTGILAYEFPTSLPLLATDAFRGNAATYGLMAAVMACGAVIGGLVAAGRSGRPHPRMLAWVCIGWGAAILAAGLAPNLATVCVVLVLVGYGSISFNSAAKTTLQLASRPELRGRVMALWAMAWGGSSAIGAPLVGWVAQEFGSRWGLIIGGAPTILLGAILVPYLRRTEPAVA